MAKAFARELYFYTTPAEAAVILRLDDGRELRGEPCTANGRQDAHRILVPPDVPMQGAVLNVTAEGMIPFDNRGIVSPDMSPDTPCFILDDVRLAPVPAPPPEPEPVPPPDPSIDPFALIRAVYEQGDFDLSTKAGSGLYTEAACTALHDQHSHDWGHIRKEPPQNHVVGPSGECHAVDAIMLRSGAGDTGAGTYDIIWSCESPEAAPSWSYKGPPDLNLWFYPA